MYWKEHIEKINRAEKEGVFVESKGFRFKIAAVSKSYGKALNDKVRELGLVSIRHLEEETLFDITIEHLLKDWDGFYDHEGNVIPFSIEKSKEILLSKDEKGELIFKEVFEELAAISVDKNEFYKQAIVKN